MIGHPVRALQVNALRPYWRVSSRTLRAQPYGIAEDEELAETLRNPSCPLTR
jgi:hypothetical protein